MWLPSKGGNENSPGYQALQDHRFRAGVCDVGEWVCIEVKLAQPIHL